MVEQCWELTSSWIAERYGTKWAWNDNINIQPFGVLRLFCFYFRAIISRGLIPSRPGASICILEFYKRIWNGLASAVMSSACNCGTNEIMPSGSTCCQPTAFRNHIHYWQVLLMPIHHNFMPLRVLYLTVCRKITLLKYMCRIRVY